MALHDFTTFPLGAVAGYTGNGADTDWVIADIPTGRRLYVPNYPSSTWLQTTFGIITSAAIEFETPDNDAFFNIGVGIKAGGIDLCQFSVSESTLYCATYGNFVVTEPLPPRLRLEVEIGDSEYPTVTATLLDADTNALLGQCSDSLFAPLANSVFGMLVDGYPAGIEASISRFEWNQTSVVVTPEPLLGDTNYQPWADFTDPPELLELNSEPRGQNSDNPYAPWSLFEEATEPTAPISGTRAQSKNSSYAPWSYLEDVPPEPELPEIMLTNAVSARLFEATDILEADGLYERAQMDIAPDWMLDGSARAFLRSSGALKDDLAELLLGAAFISMAVGADRDTLERKARDRALFVIPLEPLEVLRERVSNAFDVLDMAGTLPGLEKALFDAGWNTRILELYTQMPTDDWDETDLDVWDETTLEVWDGGEAQMFIVFVWQRIPVPLVVQQLPILIQQFKSAESLLKALYQLPNNWDNSTPLPWESAGTLIYGG